MSDADRPCYGGRVDLALTLATHQFRNKRRKSTEIPYLSHLLQVMVWVAEHGGDEDQMIAAVLHDYLEDVPGSSQAELAGLFGERVARMVVDLSDTVQIPKPPWGPRKLAYLEHLATTGPEVRLISAADKLHNATSIRRDLEDVGLAVFDRFTMPMSHSLWYYRAVYRVLADGWQHRLLDRLDREVDRIHQLSGVDRVRGDDPMPDLP